MNFYKNTSKDLKCTPVKPNFGNEIYKNYSFDRKRQNPLKHSRSVPNILSSKDAIFKLNSLDKIGGFKPVLYTE